MLTSLYNFILFNPYIVSLRLWLSLHRPIADVFEIKNYEDVRLSYIYSLVYSGFCTTIAPYSFYLLVTQCNTVYLYLNTPNTLANLYYYMSLGYFSSDLIIGYQKYRRVLNKNYITSYVHHIIYILFFIYGNTNHKLNLYLLGVPFEIPIFLRSLEMVNPELRQLYNTSYFFASLYFIFRILYNILLIILAYQYGFTEYYVFLSLALLAHITWIIKYVNKYIIIKI